MWTSVLLSNSRLKTINSAGAVGGMQIDGSWMQEVDFQKLSSLSKVMRQAEKACLTPLHVPGLWRSWTQGACHQDLHHRCAQTETRLDPWLGSGVGHPLPCLGLLVDPAMHHMLLVVGHTCTRVPLGSRLIPLHGADPFLQLADSVVVGRGCFNR